MCIWAVDRRGTSGKRGKERVTDVVLLEGKSSAEVGAKTTLGIAVDLLPSRAILEHTLQGNVVALLPRCARVVDVAVGRRPV